MVMFLGIELMIEAVWESAQTLVLLEYLVVIGTLLACTFAGFAPGFGIGIATAAVVYLAYGVVDSVRNFPPFFINRGLTAILFV